MSYPTWQMPWLSEHHSCLPPPQLFFFFICRYRSLPLPAYCVPEHFTLYMYACLHGHRMLCDIALFAFVYEPDSSYYTLYNIILCIFNSPLHLTKFSRLCESPLLETSLFFLLSWSSFLATEATGLSGEGCMHYIEMYLCVCVCRPVLWRMERSDRIEIMLVNTSGASSRNCMH